MRLTFGLEADHCSDRTGHMKLHDLRDPASIERFLRHQL
jgi:hypothetical protein